MFKLILLLCFVACFAKPGEAADHAAVDAARYWQELTKVDLESAYTLLADNHPGAVPEVGDHEFTGALRNAHATALARIPSVKNFEGYVAVMAEFAGSMRDGHIWSSPKFIPGAVYWAGLIAEKRGPNWVISNEEPKVVGTDLVGARILSCDGRPVEALARDVLRFRTDITVEALQVVNGLWLLVDEGNPFLRRPRACIFERGGKSIPHTLNWSEIRRSKLFNSYWKEPYGKSGFGLRQSGDGYWIAIQEMSVESQPVIDAVKAQRDKIRSAPYAVLDLRGNGGGNDMYGQELAEELYGKDYVKAMGGVGAADACDNVCRASKGNTDMFVQALDEAQKNNDKLLAEEVAKDVKLLKEATNDRRPLTKGRLSCPPTKKAVGAASQPRLLMHGELFVLTDSYCFSSCASTTEFFRSLGAIQIGRTTGYSTHYTNVREILLPSGLSTFSTLTCLSPDWPLHTTPNVPKYFYDGDIADTASLEKWVQNTVMSAK